MRNYLTSKLQGQITHNGIDIPDNVTFKPEDIVSQSKKKKYTELGMSNDALSVVNAFMIENKMRFPLIIDPTGNVYK